MKFSLCIPYKQRLDNIRLAFEGLANQTMDSAEFEILVGAMEYSRDYIDVCEAFDDRLNIVTVMSARDFSIPAARNLAMRQATGEVIVQLDADTLLPPATLQNLYDRYFAFGQRICVAGQVVGYDNNTGGDISAVPTLPYEEYLAMLTRPDGPRDLLDLRAGVEHLIPWTFAWTGLLALPAAAVREHDLFFDEGFRGWGVDDLEWGYRICASGIPIIFREDIGGLHLPHTRNSGVTLAEAKANWGRFLRKHPGPAAELAAAFGDVEANRLFREFTRELREVSGGTGLSLIRERDTLTVGSRTAGPESLPLAGLAIPYRDASIAECRILPTIEGFSRLFRDQIHAEARRVAVQVRVTDPG